MFGGAARPGGRRRLRLRLAPALPFRPSGPSGRGFPRSARSGVGVRGRLSLCAPHKTLPTHRPRNQKLQDPTRQPQPRSRHVSCPRQGTPRAARWRTVPSAAPVQVRARTRGLLAPGGQGPHPGQRLPRSCPSRALRTRRCRNLHPPVARRGVARPPCRATAPAAIPRGARRKDRRAGAHIPWRRMRSARPSPTRPRRAVLRAPAGPPGSQRPRAAPAPPPLRIKTGPPRCARRHIRLPRAPQARPARGTPGGSHRRSPCPTRS